MTELAAIAAGLGVNQADLLAGFDQRARASRGPCDACLGVGIARLEHRSVFVPCPLEQADHAQPGSVCQHCGNPASRSGGLVAPTDEQPVVPTSPDGVTGGPA